MKRIIGVILVAVLMLAIAACGSKGGTPGKLIVGAANVPHAEILEKAKPLLKEKGITLVIKPFQDIVLPNKALAEKEIDANYFQHIPFLDKAVKDNGFELVSAGAVHIEPFGIYSRNYKKTEDVKEGATFLKSNNPSEFGRILMLLESKGLIKLKDGVDKITATDKDIAENPKKIKFLPEIDPGLLPQAYKNNEADLIAINTNYALDAGLDPQKDSLILESGNSPYANIIAVRKGDETRKEIVALMDVLKSEAIANFINEKYKGAVMPVTGK
ncbi:MetQ/NlpA family ABC transporter substrate-binding protein [Paenibacillus sp. MBLB4367]|uniref:MetQ/NlpA family ABC transporter substrate-binding protein n=1 Tax=Paenibacillus sp. MBLB4367 TaxID=3384767 RepID=UPI003907F2D4